MRFLRKRRLPRASATGAINTTRSKINMMMVKVFFIRPTVYHTHTNRQ